eukprot:2663343-Prorocentrum_lima.AAC.1
MRATKPTNSQGNDVSCVSLGDRASRCCGNAVDGTNACRHPPWAPTMGVEALPQGGSERGRGARSPSRCSIAVLVGLAMARSQVWLAACRRRSGCHPRRAGDQQCSDTLGEARRTARSAGPVRRQMG